MLRIQLDSVRRYRSASEYRNVNRASWGGLESVGDGANIAKLAALMLARGITGPVEIYRGETPVFLRGTVEQWAGRFAPKEVSHD